MNTATAIPPVTDWREHAACQHGLADTVGYVVAYTHFDRETGTTSFTDVEFIDSPYDYGKALDVVREARANAASGAVNATYAVIHSVYEGGHRPA